MSDPDPSPEEQGLRRITPNDLPSVPRMPPAEQFRVLRARDVTPPPQRKSSPLPRSPHFPSAALPGCRHCLNSGHVKEDLATALSERLIVLETYPVGDRRIARVPCVCAAGRAVIASWRNMPPDAAGVMLDTITGLPDQDQAIAAVEDFIAHPIGWLTFAGNYGVGKTMLMYAALNHLADLGVYGCYITAPDLIDVLRNLIHNGGDPDERLQRLIAAPLLAVDELDKYDATEFAQKTIFRLFHARYQSWQTTGTMLSYNLDRQRRLPPFLLSRMRDSRFQEIVMDGADVRPSAADLNPWDMGEGEV